MTTTWPLHGSRSSTTMQYYVAQLILCSNLKMENRLIVVLYVILG